MKNILLLICISSICLIGCFGSEEEVTINADGSGTFINTVDMSGLFDMMQMFAGMDTSGKNKFDKVADKQIDSVFSFSSFSDTASSLTAEEKKLFKNATMRMQINQEDKIFKMTMTFPFNKMDDLQKITDLQQSDKGVNPMGKTINNQEMAGMNDAALPSLQKIAKMTFKEGLIERKIDHQKLNDLKNDEQFNQLGNAEDMMSAITFSTAIRLPGAAKNAVGEKLVLSGDKKPPPSSIQC